MSDSPQQRIEADVKAALKAGDKERLATLRLLLTEIKNEKIRRMGEVDEAGFVSLVRKAIKQREEAAVQYKAGGREESAAKEESEAKILAGYLPAQVDEGQIRYVLDIGDSAMIVPAEGASVEKKRNDVFRHWMLGFGTGDIVVRAGNGVRLDLANVTNANAKIAIVNDMLRHRPITVEGA